MTHLEPVSVVHEVDINWLICKLSVCSNFIRLPVLQGVCLVEPTHLYICGMRDDVLVFNYKVACDAQLVVDHNDLAFH